MKITITKESKDYFTYNEVMTAKEIVKEYKDYNVGQDIGTLGCILNKWSAECLSWNAEIAKNNRVYNAHSAESGYLDIWINAIYDGGDVIYKVGAYITDIWESTGDNREELKSHMYIREFRESM